MRTAYADFSKFQVNEAHEELVNACFLAGKNWKLAGNKKLPQFAEVCGKRIPVVRSIGDCGQAFVKGWKSVAV